MQGLQKLAHAIDLIGHVVGFVAATAFTFISCIFFGIFIHDMGKVLDTIASVDGVMVVWDVMVLISTMLVVTFFMILILGIPMTFVLICFVIAS